MKKLLLSILLISSATLHSCGESGKTSLTAKEFADKIEHSDNKVILDVRTPEEFAGGHLDAAQNIEWNSADFAGKVEGMDKSKEIYVYCLSGGRSAEAAAALRKMGFSKVYELQGGMMQWRNAHLPEEGGNTHTAASGMTKEQYLRLVASKPKVLVDFYADWCGPCKKLKPNLDAIAVERAGTLEVIRINSDENRELCQSMGIEAIPELRLYEQGKEVWSTTGYVEKKEIEAHLQ